MRNSAQRRISPRIQERREAGTPSHGVHAEAEIPGLVRVLVRHVVVVTGSRLMDRREPRGVHLPADDRDALRPLLPRRSRRDVEHAARPLRDLAGELSTLPVEVTTERVRGRCRDAGKLSYNFV